MPTYECILYSVYYNIQRVKGGNQHQTSPMVFKGCEERDWHLIGGYTEFVKYAQSM
jgi:hypothetical protein